MVVVGWLVGVVRRGEVVSFFFQWEISFDNAASTGMAGGWVW